MIHNVLEARFVISLNKRVFVLVGFLKLKCSASLLTISYFKAGQIPVGGVCVELFARRWKRSTIERCLRDENCLGRCGGLPGCRCERQINAPGGLCQAPTNQYAPIHNTHYYNQRNGSSFLEW